MFGRFLLRPLLIFLIPLLVLNCAKPIYMNAAKSEQNVQEKIGTFEDCALRFQTGQLCLTYVWSIKPTDTVKGSFVIQLTHHSSESGWLIKDPSAQLSIVLWMPSMAHGSIPVFVNRLGPGIYEATNIFFLMPGEWEIHFQLKSNGQVVEQTQTTLSI